MSAPLFGDCLEKKIKVVPLGVGVVSRAGLLVRRLVSGLLVSVSVSGLLLAEKAEDGQEKGAEDEDEETENDSVLDRGGVEGEGGGAVGGHGDVAQPGGAGLLAVLVDLDGPDGGKEGEGNNGVHPLHGDEFWRGGLVLEEKRKMQEC